MSFNFIQGARPHLPEEIPNGGRRFHEVEPLSVGIPDALVPAWREEEERAWRAATASYRRRNDEINNAPWWVCLIIVTAPIWGPPAAILAGLGHLAWRLLRWLGKRLD